MNQGKRDWLLKPGMQLKVREQTPDFLARFLF